MYRNNAPARSQRPTRPLTRSLTLSVPWDMPHPIILLIFITLRVVNVGASSTTAAASTQTDCGDLLITWIIDK